MFCIRRTDTKDLFNGFDYERRCSWSSFQMIIYHFSEQVDNAITEIEETIKERGYEPPPMKIERISFEPISS